MTSNKKQKSKIRARMERTGESYTTARRAVLAPSFRAVAQQAIACAAKAREESDARAKEKADDSGFLTIGDLAELAADPRPRPLERKLEALLLSLSAEYQQKLRTLMYFGRDHDEETEDDIRGLHKSLRRMDNPEYGPVDNMMEKAPLSEYLARGLSKCDGTGIRD